MRVADLATALRYPAAPLPNTHRGRHNPWAHDRCGLSFSPRGLSLRDAPPTPSFLDHLPVTRLHTRRGALAIALAGLLGLVWFHRADFASHFTGLSGDAGDTRLIAFLLEHQWQAFLGHAPWTSPPMFFPTLGTLGYADAFLLQGLLYWPLRAGGCDVLTALQFSTLALNALNYIAMAWLLRRVLHLGALPAIAGALLFAFNSAKFNQFVHLQLQPLLLLPIVVALLVSVAQRHATLTPRAVFLRLSAALLLLDLQLLSGVYVAWFFGFFGLLCLVFAGLFAQTRTWLVAFLRTKLRPIVGAGLVFLLGLVPFLVLYIPVLRQAGWRSFGDAQGMIPHWFSLFAMGDGNLLWAWVEQTLPRFHEQPFWWEHRIGLGAVVTVAWLLVFARVLRTVRKWPLRAHAAPSPGWPHVLAILTLAVTAFYLLGMTYFGHSPWWFAFHTVPGIKSIRAVSRYVIVLTLPIGIVLAWSLDALQTRVRPIGQVVLLILVAVAALEQVGKREGFDKATENARLQALAGKLPKDCKAFYITSPQSAPSSNVSVQIDAMFVAQLTGVPTLNGYSGQAPRDWDGLFFVRSADYPGHVQNWISTHNIAGPVCQLDDPD